MGGYELTLLFISLAILVWFVANLVVICIHERDSELPDEDFPEDTCDGDYDPYEVYEIEPHIKQRM